MTGFSEIWVYLSASPLLWLTATLAAYWLGWQIHARAGQSALANPIAIAIAILVAVLLITDTSYGRYFDGAQFVHFLLGPAVVAIGVPLYANLKSVKRMLLPMAAALLVGAGVGVLSAVGIASLMGAGASTIWSLAPKSATAPIAMGVAEATGGVPALTAVLVVLTGILGSTIAPPLLRALGHRDDRAVGFSMGLAAHGIATARAFQISEIAGLYSGLAMGLNGLATAILVPILFALMR